MNPDPYELTPEEQAEMIRAVLIGAVNWDTVISKYGNYTATKGPDHPVGFRSIKETDGLDMKQIEKACQDLQIRCAKRIVRWGHGKGNIWKPVFDGVIVALPDYRRLVEHLALKTRGKQLALDLPRKERK
jgi:hypothetical protein